MKIRILLSPSPKDYNLTIVHVLISRGAPSPIKPQSLQILHISILLDYGFPSQMSVNCLALIELLLHYFSYLPWIYQKNISIIY